MPMLIVPRFSCAAPLLRRQPDMAALKYPHAVRTYCSSRPAPAHPSDGVQRFTFTSPTTKQSLDVRCYIPEDPIGRQRLLFVIHGIGRTAEGYFNTWLPYAQQMQVTLCAPKFDRNQFPTEAEYQLGNVMQHQSSKENQMPPAKKQKTATDAEDDDEQSDEPVQQPAGLKVNQVQDWSLNLIEQLFVYLKQHYGVTASSYMLYGHSAGSQFVHRFMLLMPQQHASLAIAANAGWYTMPDASIQWPYGLKGSPVDFTGATAKRLLALPLVVLLGEKDVESNYELRHTKEADAQGLNRFERGHAFMQSCQQAAEQLGVPCNWRMQVVPNASHKNTQMVAAAAQVVKQHIQQQCSSKAG